MFVNVLSVKIYALIIKLTLGKAEEPHSLAFLDIQRLLPGLEVLRVHLVLAIDVHPGVDHNAPVNDVLRGLAVAAGALVVRRHDGDAVVVPLGALAARGAHLEGVVAALDGHRAGVGAAGRAVGLLAGPEAPAEGGPH